MLKTQKMLMDESSRMKELTGVSEKDFDLLKKTAPEAREWADSVVHFFSNVHSLTDHQEFSEATLKKYYLSFFDAENNEEIFEQEKTPPYAVLSQAKKNNEFLIGFSAMLMTTYGAIEGATLSAAFERIFRAKLAFHTKELN